MADERPATRLHAKLLAAGFTTETMPTWARDPIAEIIKDQERQATKLGGEETIDGLRFLARAAELRKLLTVYRVVQHARSRLKHGPGGRGEAGPCDPDCLKCTIEAACVG